MKKWITAVLAALLALSVSAAFVACGDGETPGGDGGNGENTDTKSYTVTKTESDLYDYGWSTTTATAGTAAYVEVTPEYEAVSIAAVYYNGQACTKDAENEERYNFTMPAEDVTITVETDLIPNTEDNFVKWSEDADTAGRTDDSSWQINFEFDVRSSFWGAKVNLYTMDETVIPQDALSYELEKNSGGIFTNGWISIDCDKIAVGSTKIGILIKSTNTGSTALLVTAVTVSDPPQKRPVDTWTETVVFQPFSVDTENLYIQFKDLTYDETLDAPQYQMFYDPNKWSDRDTWTLNEDNMIEVQFEYVPDHEYSVTVGYLGETKTIRINETFATYAEYKNDKLTFDREGGSIQFSLLG